MSSSSTDSPVARSARRLDAESLRDAMLLVSGELDLTSGGPYVPTKTDKQGQVIIDEKHSGAFRRSLYLQQRRTAPVNFLSTFDGPNHNPVCVQRVSSTVALQSLSLLNSEFVHLRARAFAKRVMGSAAFNPLQSADDEARRSGLKSTLHYAFELAYSRAPTNDELSAAEDFIREQAPFTRGNRTLTFVSGPTSAKCCWRATHFSMWIDSQSHRITASQMQNFPGRLHRGGRVTPVPVIASARVFSQPTRRAPAREPP
jgi:hypothetical protein